MGCDCGNALIAILVISDVGKKMSSQVISMKDLNVVYDATELLKIMDKVKYMIISLKFKRKEVMNHYCRRVQ